MVVSSLSPHLMEPLASIVWLVQFGFLVKENYCLIIFFEKVEIKIIDC